MKNKKVGFKASGFSNVGNEKIKRNLVTLKTISKGMLNLKIGEKMK